MVINTPRGDYVILLDPLPNGLHKQLNPRTNYKRDVVRMESAASVPAAMRGSMDVGGVDDFCVNWSSNGRKGLDANKLFPVYNWSPEWRKVQAIFSKVGNLICGEGGSSA